MLIAIVANATATNAAAIMAVIAAENSGTVDVGVAVGIADVNVIPLSVGTQSASMAAPLDVGV